MQKVLGITYVTYFCYIEQKIRIAYQVYEWVDICPNLSMGDYLGKPKVPFMLLEFLLKMKAL